MDLIKEKNRKKVEDFFKSLAEWQGLPIDHQWKAALVKNIGNKLHIKKANTIAVWIS